MDITIYPGALSGMVKAIPSKSQAHRLLICAAFARGDTALICPDTNRDIEATAQCLRALGADIRRTAEGYLVHPAERVPAAAALNCGESGSTLRFLLPVAGALGVDAVFKMEGRLPQRPLSPLWEELERMGCTLSRPTADTIRCRGRLTPGPYRMDGGVSSQFISGLLFALSLMDRESSLQITGCLESGPYVDMTCRALRLFGIDPRHPGGCRPVSPGTVEVEGDWSNGAFFLAAKALGSRVTVTGLDPDSPQGDRAVAALLPRLTAGNETVSAADIPDLIPVLAVTAAACHGAVFTHAGRLRLKESDRLESVAAMLRALGGRADIGPDTLTVYGTGFQGGTVDALNDHRIAMAAAAAATVCTAPVTILGAEAVEKSYPGFWADYRRAGGQYEQHLR